MSALRIRLLPLFSLLLATVSGATTPSTGTPALENDVLQIKLDPHNASLTIVDKRVGSVWHQLVSPGYSVKQESLKVTPTFISARVSGAGGPYDITISLIGDMPHAFNLLVDIPVKRYTTMPSYPFVFQAPTKSWYYVQNTSGEGMLMPLNKPTAIEKQFTWSGSQPWWGLTDLNQAMTVRLDSFRNPDGRATPNDRSAYAVPLRIHYAFFAKGGYSVLAKDYRGYFLQTHPELKPLRARIQSRPALSTLQDGVYVYLWGQNPAEDLNLVKEMKAAGVAHGIAVFYGKHEITKELCDGIKHLGWVVGRYRMPTGNLFRVYRKRGWPNAVLTGALAPAELLAKSNPRGWDRICATYLLPRWISKAKESIAKYGLELFYFDTLVVQLAPCLDPAHPSTVEENEQGRLAIMEKTRDLGMIVGSGEGLCPSWALPGVDYFEGLMSLRPYAETRLRIPAGGYETDLGNSYRKQAAFTLDETRRIPLYQLAFHDYVVGTWVWRDSNFQSTPFAWKKDLFNILYGTMPMWHIDRRLWEQHRNEFISSYKNVASVRARIGFAEMKAHGWLTADRSVQFTDWDTGDRVIVNFGDHPFERDGKASVPASSYTVEQQRKK